MSNFLSLLGIEYISCTPISDGMFCVKKGTSSKGNNADVDIILGVLGFQLITSPILTFDDFNKDSLKMCRNNLVLI